jgi:hypothetical protein
MKEFIAGRVNCENEHARWQVQDIAIVKMRTAYIAVEIIRRNQVTGDLDNTTKMVVALIFLLDYRPNDRDCDTGYKDMDETMGPYESECPERILQLLTPTTHEHSLAWRQRCWDNIAQRKSFRIAKGLVFETQPISFVDGIVRSRFKVFSLKPLRLLCQETGMMCRIPRKRLQALLIRQNNQKQEHEVQP